MKVELSEVNISELSCQTKQVLSLLLNPRKRLAAENGKPRDWTGIADLINISCERLPSLMQSSDPTMQILEIMQSNDESFTLDELQNMFKLIDRWDVYDDTLSLFEKDAIHYFERTNRSPRHNPIEIPNGNHELDQREAVHILTIDDVLNTQQGVEEQYYDAFVLYADEDVSVLKEIVDNLEGRSGLKLCVKERDLIAGIKFEHDAVMELISKRCNKVLVVLSPNFLKSPVHEYFLSYANGIGIAQRINKIVPFYYKRCTLPPQYSCFYMLDYNEKRWGNFWMRLQFAVRPPRITPCSQRSSQAESPTLNEITQTATTSVSEEEITKEEEEEEDQVPTDIYEGSTHLSLPCVSDLSDLQITSSESKSTAKSKVKHKKSRIIINCVKKLSGTIRRRQS